MGPLPACSGGLPAERAEPIGPSPRRPGGTLHPVVEVCRGAVSANPEPDQGRSKPLLFGLDGEEKVVNDHFSDSVVCTGATRCAWVGR